MAERGGRRTFQPESGWRWRSGEDLPAGNRAHVLGGGLGTEDVGFGHSQFQLVGTHGGQRRTGEQTRWAERRLGEALCAQTPSFLLTLSFCTEHPVCLLRVLLQNQSRFFNSSPPADLTCCSCVGMASLP